MVGWSIPALGFPVYAVRHLDRLSWPNCFQEVCFGYSLETSTDYGYLGLQVQARVLKLHKRRFRAQLLIGQRIHRRHQLNFRDRIYYPTSLHKQLNLEILEVDKHRAIASPILAALLSTPNTTRIFRHYQNDAPRRTKVPP